LGECWQGFEVGYGIAGEIEESELGERWQRFEVGYGIVCKVKLGAISPLLSLSGFSYY
jgi:hypothetical protein